MSRRSSRRRSSAVVLTCAGLALGATTLGAAAATGATAAPTLDPASDCAVPFPVSELAAGDLVDGLTVTSGTTPVGFTGEVLGVLHDGIAPDVDMIMVDLDMPAFDRTGGVWQGMSGSPVYAEDGRLIGAVAYGLSWGPSPIAGITPFEAMDDYLTPSTVLRSSVPLGKADARVVADRAGVTREQAAQGFRELPMPLGVAGVSARRLAQAEKSGPKFLQKDTYLLGRAGVDAAGPETIVAGGNLAASASYGDITFAGVGTATSVCNGEVVGFGHPLFGLGSTTLGLHPADAIYIQPDSLGSPFKVANISPVAGTITDDRATGITGAFGAAPDATTVSSDVTYGTRSRLGTTDVTVAEALPDVTFYELLVNQDRVLDGNRKGTSVQGWTLRGSDDGSPFTLRFEDRFTSSDLSFETAWGLADLAWNLTTIDGVTVDSLAATSQVNDNLKRSTIAKVQQHVGSTWTTVSGRKPVLTRPGGVVRLRLLLSGSAGASKVRLEPITIPKRAFGRAALVVQGGDSSYSGIYGETVADLRAAIRGALRHDEISVQLATYDKIDVGSSFEDIYFKGSGPTKPSGSSKPVSFSSKQVVGPRSYVVAGSKSIVVKIR